MKALEITDRLAPADVLTAAKTGSLTQFLALYGDSLLLLVRLRAEDPELSTGLWSTAARSTAQGAPRPNGDALEFHTVVQPARKLRPVDAASPKRLASLLDSSPHFAVPLRKRLAADAAFAGRISVGRALNKDVVLRHGSVSKFHAWFEQTDGDFRLADAGSKNSTFVNGEAIEPRALRPVEPGDTIRFGSVETVLCSAEELFKAVH